jgi:hypothetical protein
MYLHGLKPDKLPGISQDTEWRGYRDETNTVQSLNLETEVEREKAVQAIDVHREFKNSWSPYG